MNIAITFTHCVTNHINATTTLTHTLYYIYPYCPGLCTRWPVGKQEGNRQRKLTKPGTSTYNKRTKTSGPSAYASAREPLRQPYDPRQLDVIQMVMVMVMICVCIIYIYIYTHTHTESRGLVLPQLRNLPGLLSGVLPETLSRVWNDLVVAADYCRRCLSPLRLYYVML